MLFRIVLAGAVSLLAVQNVAAQAPAAMAAAEKMTNANVIELVKAGLPDDTVIAKVRSGGTAFDLSTEGLIALKAAGVSGPVMAAMISPGQPAPVAELSIDSLDPAVPHYPGLYIVERVTADGKMTRIDPTVSNQARTSNILGYALTMGIASASVKASIPGESARTQTRNKQPIFYAYFEESVPRSLQNANASTWASGAGTTTSSPAEVTLVRFTEAKGRRDAKVGRVNIGGAKTGVMEKDQVEFSSELVRPGVYKISLGSPLAPGEYGFIQALSGGGTQGAMTARVFDFGVE